MLRTRVSYWRVPSAFIACGSSIVCLRTKPPFAPVATMTAFLTICALRSPRISVR